MSKCFQQPINTSCKKDCIYMKSLSGHCELIKPYKDVRERLYYNCNYESTRKFIAKIRRFYNKLSKSVYYVTHNRVGRTIYSNGRRLDYKTLRYSSKISNNKNTLLGEAYHEVLKSKSMWINNIYKR